MNPLVAAAILDDRRIAYALTDQELRIVEMSDALGLLTTDPTGSIGRSLFEIVPELVGSEAELSAILAGERARHQLYLVNRSSGDETSYLNMIDLPYRQGANERPEVLAEAGGELILGLLHVAEDVSETGRLQQRLAQHRNELRLIQEELAHKNMALLAVNEELREMDDMKSRFVSVAAHELRTPLSAIKGYVDLLLDGQLGTLSDVQHNSLRVVQNGADRLLVIIRNLLDVTRIESGRVELFLEPKTIGDLVRSAITELEPQWNGKRQTVVFHLPHDLPLALCDETRANQILSNLLSNAIKYTPDGGHIEVTVEPAAEEGYLLLSVIDDGVGIPEQDQKKLFTRFFRAETAYQTRAHGAGLGLHITRSLVELHGGRIWYKSKVGVGSTFYVTWPTAELAQHEPE